jgi:hypothetical protein
MQLQLSFFQNNQIGKITAFMREMANIRHFMTGNSLTECNLFSSDLALSNNHSLDDDDHFVLDQHP